VILVNGKVISDEQVAREAQYHPAPSREAAVHEASVALVIRQLLLQEAVSLGIAEAPGAGGAGADPADGSVAPEERAIASLLDREIRLPVADEEVLRRYYEANRERFRSPDLFEASHILFAARPDQPEERQRARAAAAATLEELLRDPSSFERLAKERSADPESREQGGHIGQVTRGQTTPEFEAALDSLTPGEIGREPVGTRYGWHLVRLDRAVRGRQLPYNLSRERIAEYLGAGSWTRAVHQYIQILVGKASIEGIELAGAATPLVQ
jgi:peptidyl-prolyl cis-trans isomerase C